MTAFAFDDFGPGRREKPWSHWGSWGLASIILHLLVLLWLVWPYANKPMTMGDELREDRPVVEVTSVQVNRPVAMPPDFQVETDTPDNALPPAARRLNAKSDFNTATRDNTAVGIQAIDPKAIEQFLKEQDAAKADVTGEGSTYRTCSLLSPERRALEPACDGFLLKRDHDTGLAILTTPDGETVAAIKRLEAGNAEIAARRDAEDRKAFSVGERNDQDRSYRNQADERFGKLPWE